MHCLQIETDCISSSRRCSSCKSIVRFGHSHKQRQKFLGSLGFISMSGKSKLLQQLLGQPKIPCLHQKHRGGPGNRFLAIKFNAYFLYHDCASYAGEFYKVLICSSTQDFLNKLFNVEWDSEVQKRAQNMSLHK